MTNPRHVGVAAICAGVFLFVSVAAEIVHPVQQGEEDATVTEPALFALYLLAWIIGAASLVVALLRLRLADMRGQAKPRRSFLVGRRTSLVGAALLLGFGVLVLVTGLATDAPAEWSFIFFGLGFLLLIVGQVVLGLAIRRNQPTGASWPLLLVASAGALLAVTVFSDPWHDIGMFTFDAGWALFGVGLLRQRQATENS